MTVVLLGHRSHPILRAVIEKDVVQAYGSDTDRLTISMQPDGSLPFRLRRARGPARMVAVGEPKAGRAQ